MISNETCCFYIILLWCKAGMLRNAVFQTHEEPVPEDIVKNNIRTIGVSKEEFDKVLEEVKNSFILSF